MHDAHLALACSEGDEMRLPNQGALTPRALGGLEQLVTLMKWHGQHRAGLG